MQHSAHGADAGTGTALALGLILAGVLLSYLIAATRERQRGRGWSTGRAASFAAGIGLLGLATLPQITTWAHQDLRGHMAQHLLLGMLAPLGLVLGAPATLVLRILPVQTARRVSAVLRSGIVGRLTHPITALVLDTGGLYLLYLTPLYSWIHMDPLVFGLVHVHFLAAGYLFAWSIAGPDPAPHRPRLRVRVAVLFVAIAAHSTLAKVMYAYGWPWGVQHDLAEIRHAAQIMYYGGDIAELLLAIVIFASWYRRSGRRHQRELARAHAGLGAA